MHPYLAEILLPEVFTPELIQLIPEQRAMVDSLLNIGLITSYSLSLDRTKLWITFYSPSNVEVIKLLERFPIYEFIEEFSVKELMFHNSATMALPAISLN